ncbi:MAG TPA: lysophospholipid acyltransferase family protein [Spirochaetota bacterium]|nr:lysophospholipid acyltransferase family protein [Spirochaetota bacterium]
MLNFHRFFWILQQLTICKKITARYRVKFINHAPEPQPPCLVLGNHAFFLDPWIVGSRTGFAICYMTSEDGFKGALGLNRLYAKMVKMFPKKKAQTDSRAIRTTLKLIKQGYVVGIFPEGDRSWDGETDKLFPNVISLIKKLKVPLRIAHLSGNYLSGPRWADYRRYGKIIVDFHTISVAEISGSSDHVLYQKIKKLLYNNDVKNPALQDITFQCKKPAAGVERLLWLCPHCRTHDSITGSGNLITCSKCHSQWRVDANQRLSPAENSIADLKDWNDWQKKTIPSLWDHAADSEITRTDNIILAPLDKQKHVLGKMQGSLIMYKSKVRFIPESKKHSPVVFTPEKMYFFVDYFNKYSEFVYHKKDFRIYFKRKNALKWIEFLRYIQNYYNKASE